MSAAWGILTVALICGATHRLTRLVTSDAFPPLAAPRDWVLRKLGEDHWFSYLVTCMWCASMYVSASVVLLVDHWVSVPLPWLTWLTASSVTGWLAVHEPED